MDLSEPQGKLFLAIIVAVVLVVGYFLWTKSAPPTPRVPAGQTLDNPFGPGQAPGPPVGRPTGP
jgi:hypothetical protein